MIDRRRFRYLLAHCAICGNMTDDATDLFCPGCRKGRTPEELEREAGHRQQIQWRFAALHSKPQ